MSLEQTTFNIHDFYKVRKDLEQSHLREKSQFLGHFSFPSLTIIGVYAICMYLFMWM